MAIPDYQTLMRPLLQRVADGGEHTVSELLPLLAAEFDLTEDEQSRLLPSGRAPVLRNRLHWAAFYMIKAGLLDRPRRGHLRITTRGAEALRQIKPINHHYLQQFAEFQEYTKSTRATPEPGSAPGVPAAEAETPEELVEAGYQRHRESLASDVLAKIKGCSPQFFERLVVDLLVAMGYGGSRQDAAQAVGQSGDEGVDGIIKEDRLGLDAVYVQAKRWENTVGRPVLQAFAGSLEGQRARKGVLITTSDFSKEARDYVTRIEKRIVLISGPELADLMIEHGIGVTDVATFTLRRLDSDYFEEGE
jgi:restriction system protein